MEELARKIANFIHAQQRRNVHRELFQECNRELDKATVELTDAIYAGDMQQRIAGENVLVTFEGDTYMVTLDVEGNHGHRITPIDQVLDL